METKKIMLNAEYIESHLDNLHTHDSWAKAVLEMVLRSASKQLQGESKETISLPFEFTVTAIPLKTCVKVCVGDGHGHSICTHIGV